MRRLLNRIYYLVETLFLKGTLYQLLAVALIILLLSSAGGTTVWAFSPEYQDLLKSVWWAFLRLTDPGYLGDDQGALPRTISTLLTLAGYVFFLGALVAIMTNRLDRFMENLASGLSPIFEEDHILIIGWNARVHSLVEEIGHAENRVKRRLDRNRLPAVVVLTREFEPDLRKELLEKLDESVRDRVRVLMRAGNPLEQESLERVDFKRASSVILVSPSDGAQSRHLTDIQLVKILLTLKAESRDVDPEHLPNVVLEIGNPANKLLAERAGWRRKTEAIASDDFMSRLVSHTIRNPGLSSVYNHLLTDTFGESIYLREAGELGIDGLTLREAVPHFPRAVPIGLLRPSEASMRREQRLMLLHLEEVLEPEDELIVVAPSIDAVEETEPQGDRRKDAPATTLSDDSEVRDPGGSPLRPAPRREQRRLLFVGWNHLLSPVFRELAGLEAAEFEITLVTELSRSDVLERLHFDVENHDNLDLTCERATLDRPDAVAKLDPDQLDNVVLLGDELNQDPLMEDAETIMTFVQLREYFQREPEAGSPSFVIELNDEDNRNLFEFGATHDVVMTQEIISHLLSQVGMRRALAWIYEELFTRDGAEIRLCPVDSLFETPPDPSIRFRELQELCLEADTVALGVRHRYPKGSPQRLLINPPRETSLDLDPDDEVVLVSSK